MARAGSRRHRERQAPKPRATSSLRREDELVEQLLVLDHALGVRNRILARFGDQLTDVEKRELGTLHASTWDFDQAYRDLGDEFSFHGGRVFNSATGEEYTVTVIPPE